MRSNFFIYQQDGLNLFKKKLEQKYFLHWKNALQNFQLSKNALKKFPTFEKRAQKISSFRKTRSKKFKKNKFQNLKNSLFSRASKITKAVKLKMTTKIN